MKSKKIPKRDKCKRKTIQDMKGEFKTDIDSLKR
jgi:hypothetical protein